MFLRHMALSVGIVGLPNVGKSTLFNALSSNKAEAANYAFCTIDPNVGVVPVPDPRADALVKLFQSEKSVAASVQFVDIAGLVRGASKGEGKGNAFLSHIRECHAVAHVVRCFEDDNVLHVDGKVDPESDVSTIETELVLRDLETVEKRLDKAKRSAKSGNADDKRLVDVGERLKVALDAGQVARTVSFDDERDERVVEELCLLTQKPMFFVANVKESQLAGLSDDPLWKRAQAIAAARHAPIVPISAAIEAEIMDLPLEERADFLASLDLEEPGLNQVIRTGYEMLNLITFFTAGPKEVHAWTIPKGSKAPQAAGAIHSDFERGFIRAEVIHWKDLVDSGSEAAARSAGKQSTEGKEYVVRDGDVLHIRFNV